LAGFVAAIYIYTMRAVGSTDELQTAIETFEKQKSQESPPTSDRIDQNLNMNC
jgi:hypothetical protein